MISQPLWKKEAFYLRRLAGVSQPPAGLRTKASFTHVALGCWRNFIYHAWAALTAPARAAAKPGAAGKTEKQTTITRALYHSTCTRGARID